MEEIHPKMESEGKKLLPSLSCWERALFRTKSMVPLQRFRAPKKASKVGGTNPSEKNKIFCISSPPVSYYNFQGYFTSSLMHTHACLQCFNPLSSRLHRTRYTYDHYTSAPSKCATHDMTRKFTFFFFSFSKTNN